MEKTRIEKVIKCEGDITNLIAAFKDKMEVNRYIEIIEGAKNPKTVLDADYQRVFKKFYAIRRNKEWQNHYFGLLQRYLNEYKKGVEITFGTILKDMKEGPGGSIEISYSSKMLATINPDMPIYDENVGWILRLKKPPQYLPEDKRFKQSKCLYKSLLSEYESFTETDTCKNAIEKFDRVFPDYKDSISKVKKIDYILWLLGQANTSMC